MRWIKLDGAVNVRDIGGMPTEDGNHTLGGALIRADNLQNLSAADVRILVEQIGVRTIVDLRTTNEVSSEGPGPLTGLPSLAHQHLSLLPEATDSSTDAVADALLVRQRAASKRYAGDTLSVHYLGYLERRPDSVVAALRAITASPGPAIVHCAAGKDRTGVLTALALTVAGVPRTEVIADYVATADRIEAILARLRASPTYAADVSRRPAAEHAPQRQTMAAFFEQLDESHGGVFSWLTNHGFGADEVSELRAKLRR
ncbi:protein tyrosine/serine phosphatase [Tamaricihabitans halophyticus]|uniref:Protein tyrosine/serine phosphatase n=1 Tax=Tamaricihabitans halophyticus TaxID=1262583 RepID=A0A4R2QMK9_9PSEU|nr:tyrosine-protein phosphatase [Tamaricihabitans halophyticus]TCP50094.1 protein tyrosine/serine phosphatase [Tamaricihabitans halophyticus]